MAKPSTTPSWGTDTNFATGTESGTPVKVEPSSGYKAQGFIPGGYAVSPYLNWFMNLVFQWCTYLDGLNTDAQFLALTWAWTAAHTFTPGSGTNVTAVTGTARGTGYGLLGQASNTSASVGVQGEGGTTDSYGGAFVGSGTAAGVSGRTKNAAGTANLGTGPGVRGTGGTTGPGGDFYGGTTNGTFGVVCTSLATNGSGASCTGTGTGAGLYAEGGSGNARGINALGHGTQAGVYGTGGSTAGAGIAGLGGTGGKGGDFLGVTSGDGVGGTGGATDGTYGGVFTSSATNGGGLHAAGSGTMDAVTAVGSGNAASAAVSALGATASPAVAATTTGSGNAVTASASGGTGYGLSVSGNATKAPLHIVARDYTVRPTSPIAGDIIFDTNINKHVGYDGSAWNNLY